MTVVYRSDLVTLIHGDALRLSEYVEPESVDLIVTSPPYFSLRSYRDGDEHYDGQIGSEATPQEFLEALWAVTAECVKVLRPTGSLWVNLGDKYAGSGGHNNSGISNKSTLRGNGHVGGGPKIKATRRQAPDRYNQESGGIPAKSLMGLPWRYAIGCIDRLGLILRAEVVWDKPNGLPESVTDRVRRSHETWFHFTRQGRYFAAVDEVREPATGNAGDRHRSLRRDPDLFNPLGKLPGSVWRVPSEPLTVPAELNVDHFAAFPTEWPRRIISGWCPTGYCIECGEPRRPVVERELSIDHVQRRTRGRMDLNDDGSGRSAASSFGITDRAEVGRYSTTILGYACACTPTEQVEMPPDAYTIERHREAGYDPPTSKLVTVHRFDQWTPAPTRPAVVLDPFCGTGTVPLVASVLGRHGIGVDLSRDYLRLAQWRVNDPAQRAKVERKHTGVEPAVVDPAQLTMFGDDGSPSHHQQEGTMTP